MIPELCKKNPSFQTDFLLQNLIPECRRSENDEVEQDRFIPDLPGEIE